MRQGDERYLFSTTVAVEKVDAGAGLKSWWVSAERGERFTKEV